MAQYPAIRLDNRVWLPVLQTQIWMLYQLGLPVYAFKLIPCFYYFVSVVLIGMLAFNLAGGSRTALAFALLFALIFARQTLILSLATTLMQEIIGLALFFLLLHAGALELKKKWWLVAIAGLALLTRETFWIYLFVVSLLNWKRILSDRGYIISFLILWAVPALWLLMIPVAYWFTDGRFPEFPVEWPLGINKDANQAVSGLHASTASLWAALVKTGVVYLVAGLVLLWGVLKVPRLSSSKRPAPADRFSARFIPFSLLSVGIIYALIILFDPWQATTGARRMSSPLLIHASVWAMVIYSEAAARHRAVKLLAGLVILSSLIPSMKFDSMFLPVGDFSEVRRVYAEMEDDLNLVAQGESAQICIIDDDYFSALGRLLPATLYRNRTMVLQTRKSSLAQCDVVFAPRHSKYLPIVGFSEYKQYLIDGFEYVLLLPR